MDGAVDMITVHAGNIDTTGFFCYMSKKGYPGYQQKRDWLMDRFSEGLHLTMIHETGGRTVGFIEYIPGEYAWRAVEAPGYLFIHCLWVVGKAKGKGYAGLLIDSCINDARRFGYAGVAVLVSDRVWLVKKDVFLKYGFKETAQAPPSFRLLVLVLDGSAPQPRLPSDWQARQAAFGPGLTIVRTAQCPYIQDAVSQALEGAADLNIPARVVELRTAREVQQRSPSPYGVFGMVLDGTLLSYHFLLPKDMEKLLSNRMSGQAFG